MKTGFNIIDELVSLDAVNLFVVGARPSIGKSTLALNIAKNILEQEKSVLIFDLESSKMQIITKIVSMESMVAIDKIKENKLNDEEYNKVNSAVKKLEKLYIKDTVNITIDEIEKVSTKAKREKAVDIIIIDYIQQISVENTSSMKQKMAEISTRLKNLSKKLDMPIIIISQLPKALKLKEDKRPKLTDFNNLKSLVENADVILLLYRDDYYNKYSDHKYVPEIIISKNTTGNTGSDKLLFLKNYMKLVNLEY
ncbi:MAG: AAA family ATPase [Clostridia bacterium]|nr:AAA family ATPase [Clostridia bacterium]